MRLRILYSYITVDSYIYYLSEEEDKGKCQLICSLGSRIMNSYMLPKVPLTHRDRNQRIIGNLVGPETHIT